MQQQMQVTVGAQPKPCRRVVIGYSPESLPSDRQTQTLEAVTLCCPALWSPNSGTRRACSQAESTHTHTNGSVRVSQKVLMRAGKRRLVLTIIASIGRTYRPSKTKEDENHTLPSLARAHSTLPHSDDRCAPPTNKAPPQSIAPPTTAMDWYPNTTDSK
jgi:hypothetical protein